MRCATVKLDSFEIAQKASLYLLLGRDAEAVDWDWQRKDWVQSVSIDRVCS